MSSTMLNAEMPKNSPSKPPTTAKKSVKVYDADLMSVDTKWVLNEIVIDDVFVLESVKILINTTT